MIKQIQIRGISRTPSDRMTADGGCADSIDMYLDGQETAPMLPAVDYSDEVWGEATDQNPVVYIHKMTNTTCYIALVGSSSVCAYVNGKKDTMGSVVFGDGETYNSMCAIGNTLVVFTTQKPYYFLFKDGVYKFLGNSIPVPQIEVVSVPAYYLGSTSSSTIVAEADSTTSTAGTVGYNRVTSDGLATEVATLIWDKVASKTDALRDSGLFFAPFFIRTAVRLYDGSYINSSVPILCGGKTSNDWMYATFATNSSDSSKYDVKVTLSQIYRVRLKMAEQDLSDWSDLIQSIDVFASKPIYAPAYASSIMPSSNVGITFKGMGADEKEDTILDAVLSKSLFYKVKSFSVESTDDLTTLQNGHVLQNSDSVGGELLETQERLPDNYRDESTYTPINGVQPYNKRLLLIGAQETLPRGEQFLNGLVMTKTAYSAQSSTLKKYNVRYLIRDADGISHVVLGHYYDDSVNFCTPCLGGASLTYTSPLKHYFGVVQADNDDQDNPLTFYRTYPYAWIAYPDARCYAVEIASEDGAYGTNYFYRIPMKVHPFLDCAYAFLGFGKPLYTAGKIRVSRVVENRIINAPNKIFLSEFENPFLFPASGIITFTDEVVGAAATSVPLSEGQFGQFPLYVFTKGGIRVLSQNSEGTFSTNNAHPNLSRHIALKGTIASIEQAVVFITERGVMLLTGGTVTELSSAMNGKPYVMDSETDSVVGKSSWGSLWGECETKDTFMAFMREAQVAYDDKGKRLLFFKTGEIFLWVYMLATQTWHRMFCDGIQDKAVALNSYPDCLIATSGQEVFNFSTNLSDAALLSDTENPIKGIIITRPLDLGAPDVRKTIRSIRVRGQFNKNDVKYILVGSLDGLSWKRLTSLRGGSYKLFRIILLCNLTAAERISWIDVDYEKRFENKLR